MLVFLAGTGIAATGLLIWFFSLEYRGERHKIFLVLFFTLLVEALLAGPAADVPPGILRPRLFGQDFRPPDLVIAAALATRLLAVTHLRASRVALAWAGFIAVYVTGVIVGLLHGIPYGEVLFQGKGAFYIVGGMLIASGADVRRIGESVSNFAIVLAALVPIGVIIEAINLNISLNTPLQRLNRLGRLSNDSVTLITLIGMAVVLIEATRTERRPKAAIAGAVLLLAPAAGHQRASYLVLAVGLVLIFTLSLGSTWRRRSSLTGVETSLFGVALVGLVFAGVAATASPGVVIAPVQDAFSGEAEERSASARFTLIDQALDKIQDSPVIGSGVGTKVIRKAELSNKEVEAAAHNVVLDVAMRVGLFGLLLFLTAVIVTLTNALRVWRRARDNVVASVAIAGAFIMLGVVTKGMVEPALDKFRLSLSLGIGIGLVLAASRQYEADEGLGLDGARLDVVEPAIGRS